MLTLKDIADDQEECIEFILDGEDALICADVGTGKTMISLTAAKMKLERKEVQRWLVLAPLLVATETWAQEPSQWEHLKDLKIAIACGDENQRIAALESAAQIIVINYENLPWLLERYAKKPKKADPLPFDGLIADEIDKLKEVSTARFKVFRNRIKVFKSRIGLTGTVIPNKLEEIWGQAFLVDGGQTKFFGRSFYAWRRANFYPTDYEQRKWAPFPGTENKVLDALRPFAFYLREPPTLPKLRIMVPHCEPLPDIIRSRYDELEKEFLLYVDDAKGQSREVAAANSAVLSGKLQQICSGFSYVDRSKEAVWHSKARFDWYEGLWNDLGEQILVFYNFREELDELKRRFPDLHYLGGGVSQARAREAIRRWNEGTLTQLALHPASAGHGLNLQKSGAHHIALLTVPWSGGLWNQLIGRLRRRGQSAEAIYVHTFQFQDTIDEIVSATVQGRSSYLRSFLDALETT